MTVLRESSKIFDVHCFWFCDDDSELVAIAEAMSEDNRTGAMRKALGQVVNVNINIQHTVPGRASKKKKKKKKKNYF
jgi:hypothetical protein